MSKTIFHYPEMDKTPWSEGVIYNFIAAADLLGVLHKCKDCEACKDACKNLRRVERKVREDENKMD